MKAKPLPYLTIILLLVAFTFIHSAQAQDTSFNVTYNIQTGGLLTVNGTAIVNASTSSYTNDTALLLAATTTNANYSYVSMDLNGTVTTDNPVSYVLVSNETGVFNQTITVIFVAEAVPTPTPTPDPDALTVDDTFAVAVTFGLIAVGVSAGLIFFIRNRDS